MTYGTDDCMTMVSGFQVAVAVAATRVTFEETVGVATVEFEEAEATAEESEERKGERGEAIRAGPKPHTKFNRVSKTV